MFLGILDMSINYLDRFYLGEENEENNTYYLAYTYVNLLMRYVLSNGGNLHESYWDYAKRHWFVN